MSTDDFVNADLCIKQALQSLSKWHVACKYSERLLSQAGLHKTPPPGVPLSNIPISTLQQISRNEIDRIRNYETPTVNLVGGMNDGSSNFAMANYINRRLSDEKTSKK